MKTLALAAAAALMSAGAALADPVAGTWRTEPGDTGGYLIVKVAPCGGAICGTIAQAVDKNGKSVADYEHRGKQMLWNMKSQGNGAYGGGKIWAPDRDKTYNSKMKLSGNALEVSGCVLGICRGQVWRRVQ